MYGQPYVQCKFPTGTAHCTFAESQSRPCDSQFPLLHEKHSEMVHSMHAAIGATVCVLAVHDELMCARRMIFTILIKTSDR